MSDAPVDRDAVQGRLTRAGIPAEISEQVVAALPAHATAVLLYGSQARKDPDENSDIDLLVVANRPERTRSRGSVNISTYDLQQFRSASGSLFGTHLQRDAIVLHDTPEQSALGILRNYRPADAQRVLNSVRTLSVALRSADRGTYIEGLTRLARYLLRTATYALAIQQGEPCFSIRELSERFEDPGLLELLSSHEYVTGKPTMDDLVGLEYRLERIIGPIETNPFQSLQALIVGTWDEDPELANSTLLALSSGGQDLPYAEIPRVIL